MASQKRASQDKRGNQSTDLCKSCCSAVDLNSRFACSICQSIFHREKVCSGLNASVLKSAIDSPQILLMCLDCSKVNLVQQLFHLESRVTQLEQTSVDRLKSEDLISNAINEFQERDRKKNNIILFNIPESKEDQLDDQVNDDKAVLQQVCSALSINNIQFNSLRRIGRKSDKQRPVIITLANQDTRQMLLSNAKKLRNLQDDSPFKKIVIKPDLTKSQIQAQKQLQAALKLRKDAGEDCVIYRGKVVLRSEIKRVK